MPVTTGGLEQRTMISCQSHKQRLWHHSPLGHKLINRIDNAARSAAIGDQNDRGAYFRTCKIILTSYFALLAALSTLFMSL